MYKADAVSFYGSQQKLAEAIGRSPSTVSEWPEIVPMEHALLIEKLSRGKRKVDFSLYPNAPPQLRTAQ